MTDLRSVVDRIEWSAVDFWFNQLTVLVIALVLATTAAVFRRETRLGRRLADHEMTFAVVYLCAFLSVWFAVFTSDVWGYVVRVAVLFVALRVLLEQKRTYGGWRALGREVMFGIRHWRRPEQRGG